MTRIRLGLLAAIILAALGVGYAQDDEVSPPPAGTWKLTLPTLFKETRGFPIVLLKFEKDKKDKDKWQGTVTAALPDYETLEKATVEKITVADKAWRFTIKAGKQTMRCEVNLGKDPKASKFYGELRDGRGAIPLEIERTTMTGLDDFENFREMLASEPLGLRAAQIARILLSNLKDQKVKDSEVRAWAEKAVKSAALYGPNVARDEQLTVARTLAAQPGKEAIALQYAKRAEAGLDEKTDPPATIKRVLETLLAVQEKAGKKEDAAATLVRIKKITFPPIKLAKYAGRKGKSDRVVLIELFTAANEEAKSCVPSDSAMGALLKTFGPSELAVLVYHQHQPIGNPLSSPESEERLGFYGRQVVPSVPVVVIDGATSLRGGGGPEDAQDFYEGYVDRIEEELEKAPKAELKLAVTRKDDKLEIKTEVNKLEEPDEAIRLRVALVETETAYKGGSGTVTHYHVVRHMPGGADGIALTKKSTKKDFTVDLKDLAKKLAEYQEKVNKKKPFPTKDRPLDLKNFKVIAFVQNDMNRNEVLQAAQVEVK